MTPMLTGSTDREEMREPNATYDGFTTKNRFTTETQRLTEVGHREKSEGQTSAGTAPLVIVLPFSVFALCEPLCLCVESFLGSKLKDMTEKTRYAPLHQWQVMKNDSKNGFTTETQRLTEAGHREKPDGIDNHDPCAFGREGAAFPESRVPSPVTRIFCLLTFAFCLLACSFSFAAERPHLITRWENFTTANGMPDAKVFCVTVDGNRVWAGTEDGLVLIENGKVAKVYKPADGLAHRVVMGIAVDHETGDLWIATFGGVSHFSGGHFENFANLTSGLLNDICYGIAVQGKFVWVATTAGISRYNKDTGEWTDWSEKNAPFHEPWTYGVALAPEIGKVYFAMWGGGLIEYDDKVGYMKAYTDPDEEMEIVLFKNQGLIHIIVSGVSLESRHQDGLGLHLFRLERLRRPQLAQLPHQGQRPRFRLHQRSQVPPQRGLGLHGQGPQHARLLHQHLGQLLARKQKRPGGN